MSRIAALMSLHDKSMHQKFVSCFRPVAAMALLSLLWSGRGAAAAQSPTALQEPNQADRAGTQKPRDLTGLSLEELLQSEITPINVLGSHTHLRHEWMVGYRYMFMNQSGNLDGTREVSNAEVLGRGYSFVHTSMTMEMHMVELMYAPIDDLTFMAMSEYKLNSMDHLRKDGTSYITESKGFGDTTLMGLYNVFGNAREGKHRILLNGGLSLPTGSIQQRFNSPDRLEYMMQLGSGTYDLLSGMTYLGQSTSWAWGAQVIGTVRFGKNDVGYRLGDRYRLSSWAYYKLTEWVGPSARLDWHDWGNYHGSDPQLDPKIATNPAFDPKKQKGERLDFLVGLNFYVPRGLLKMNRLSIEGGIPVYQSLAGPNPKTDWMVTVGWSYTF